MPFLPSEEQHLLEHVSVLAFGNPFMEERVRSERAILGDEFASWGPFWHARDEVVGAPNVERIQRRVERLSHGLTERSRAGARPSKREARLFADLEVYRIYNRYERDFLDLLHAEDRGTRRVPFYRRFLADCESSLGLPRDLDPSHLFACFFQVRRAFQLIFRALRGGSRAAARLRAAVWQSVFTHDMRRYRRSLYPRMGDVTTLITGPSGTGKELVARAVGLSRYIPFDADRMVFAEDFESSFYALNLSALSPTLIESELFGHRRGAFTGAQEDREGWFEVCPHLGTVFLDEIGEVDVAIQVKLLRVLESRRFQRLGESADRRFEGKLVAATNRDLDEEVAAGRMRLDLYYRLCSDLIRTPSLQEQLRDDPGELEGLIGVLARRIAGEEEGEGLAREVVAFVERELGRDYVWPGNVRELEQCVRNIMIRGSYRARSCRPDAEQRLIERFRLGEMSLAELESAYVTRVYRQEGSFQGAGRRLGLDRRTVKAKLERSLED